MVFFSLTFPKTWLQLKQKNGRRFTMKRFLLVNILLLAVCITVFAQQAGTTARRTSSQTREDAGRFLDQARSNASQFESTQADLNARNTSNNDAVAFNRLKAEIERLEDTINTEQGRISASLDAGARVSPELLQRIERLMSQHRARMVELEALAGK
jgi:hypothetical protein